MSLASGTHLGPYEVVAPLGSGGMGEVYQARDPRLNRMVAIKVLPAAAASDDERRERFEREAQTIAALNHPNIVTIHSVEQADGQFFLTMELVEGRSLAEAMPRGGLSLDRLLKVAIPVADAMAAAHQEGITHRDLKPANIMLGEGKHDGRVKVLDFGLAKLAEAPVAAAGATALPTGPITGEGRILGTVAYMSPEQAEGKTIDARSDLFSLGVILYEMATGQRPFTGDTSISLISSILKDTPKSVMELNPALPRDLGRIVRRALAKDPTRRYQTAVDLRNDLEDLKASLDSGELTDTIGARRTSAKSYAHVWQWTAAGAAVIAIVGVALSIGLVRGRRETVASSATGPSATTASLQDVQITQLTTSGNAERPAISPDGKYVAYVQHDGNDYSLWIRQTTTNSNVQIVRPEPGVRLYDATVTPDGSFVDFIRGEALHFALWRVPFLGGTPRKLVDDVHSAVGWSPDGQHLVFVRSNSPTPSTALMIADPDGGHERTLAVRKNPTIFLSEMIDIRPDVRPAWSPDGRVIAASGADEPSGGQTGQVVFVDVSNGSERPISIQAGPGVGGELTWLGNDTLAITRTRQLWRLSYPDGRLSRVTNDLTGYVGLSLTADRDSLVTARSERRGGVWVSDTAANAGAEAVPSAPTEARQGVAWTADRLLYVSGGQGLIVRVVPGAAPEEIVSQAVTPDVTPDGRTIVFFRPVGERGLWKVDADGRQAVKLVGSGAEYGPVVTPDGRSVVFISNIGGLQSPWIVSIGGGAPRQVAKFFAGAGSLAVSPDGMSIAFWSYDEQNRRVLRTCALANCAEPKTLPAPPSAGRLRWSPDGRAIAYLDPAAANIWLLPLAGGQPRQLTHFTDNRTITDFAWSRDGKRLAIAHSTVTNDIVLFKGLKR